MYDWTSILRSQQNGPRLFAGTINEDASGLTDPVSVIIDAFSKEADWGPAPWMPRAVNGGADPLVPNKGDRCVVALAETEDPGAPEVWIVAWWPE